MRGTLVLGLPVTSYLDPTLNSAYCENEDGWINHEDYSKYGPVEDWDISKVNDMNGLFSLRSTCNPDISKWSVGGVTTFDWMFAGTSAFDYDISGGHVFLRIIQTDIYGFIVQPTH